MDNVVCPEGRSGTLEIWHSFELVVRLLSCGTADTEDATARNETRLVRANIDLRRERCKAEVEGEKLATGEGGAKENALGLRRLLHLFMVLYPFRCRDA